MIKNSLILATLLGLTFGCQSTSSQNLKTYQVGSVDYNIKPEILCRTAAECLEKGNKALETNNLPLAWTYYQSGCKEGAVRICQIAGQVKGAMIKEASPAQLSELEAH